LRGRSARPFPRLPLHRARPRSRELVVRLPNSFLDVFRVRPSVRIAIRCRFRLPSQSSCQHHLSEQKRPGLLPRVESLALPSRQRWWNLLSQSGHPVGSGKLLVGTARSKLRFAASETTTSCCSCRQRSCCCSRSCRIRAPFDSPFRKSKRSAGARSQRRHVRARALVGVALRRSPSNTIHFCSNVRREICSNGDPPARLRFARRVGILPDVCLFCQSHPSTPHQATLVSSCDSFGNSSGSCVRWRQRWRWRQLRLLSSRRRSF